MSFVPKLVMTATRRNKLYILFLKFDLKKIKLFKKNKKIKIFKLRYVKFQHLKVPLVKDTFPMKMIYSQMDGESWRNS